MMRTEYRDGRTAKTILGVGFFRCHCSHCHHRHHDGFWFMHLIQDTALQFGPGSMPPSPDRHLFNCAPHSSLELDLCTLATDCSSFHCSTVLCGRFALLLLNSPRAREEAPSVQCFALQDTELSKPATSPRCNPAQDRVRCTTPVCKVQYWELWNAFFPLLRCCYIAQGCAASQSLGVLAKSCKERDMRGTVEQIFNPPPGIFLLRTRPNWARKVRDMNMFTMMSMRVSLYMSGQLLVWSPKHRTRNLAQITQVPNPLKSD